MEIDPIDPLNQFAFSYGNYGNLQTNQESCNMRTDSNIPIVASNINNSGNVVQDITNNASGSLNGDVNPDIKKRVRRSKKVKKERSNYWSEKIKEDGFPFYACSICNINFTTLNELDQHVSTHKGRPTSYDLRLRSQLRRKIQKKEKKKLKKLQKIVKSEMDIEIKPEEGYIGNEKASDYNENINKGKTNDQLNKTSNAKLSESDTKNVDIKDTQDEINLEKIYKCFACQKQFALSYYLKLHVRSHTDEKPYTCNICGLSFITASKLGRHNKRIHLALQHICRICFKKYSRFDNLKQHFDKIHSEDKLEGEPYDYNVILPYLKELEDQLLKEKEKTEKVEAKGTEETNLLEICLQPEPKVDEDTKEFPVDQVMDQTIQAESIEVEVKLEREWVDVKEEDEIKREEENIKEESGDSVVEHGAPDDAHFDDGEVKDEDASDEDYFPLNTWSTAPAQELPPPRPDKPEGNLQCDICQKTIRSVSYMRIHMRTHTGERPFKCRTCGRGFITSSKMNRHVLTHQSQDEKVKTEGEEIKLETEIKDEREEDDHSGDNKRKKTRLKKRSKENDGTKKTYRKRPYSCDFCQKKFLHKDTLEVHRQSHEGETKELKCHYCLVVFAGEEELKGHEATHTGPKPYECTQCGKCYKRRETMIYHRKNHKADKLIQCEMCTKSFTAPCKLQRHLVSHRAGRYSLRYECPVCAHMFHTRYHVQMHLRTHQKEGLISEENRNDILAMILQNARKIPRQASGSLPAASLPADERSRVCNICGEVFLHFFYLEEHLKSHGTKIAIENLNSEEEKKYICQVCNKGFKLHYYLKLHSFTHTKQKPFICQQCGKGFITRGKLKRHLESHTGLKKYQCHICYKYFTRPSYLRIHVRTIHGTQDYNFRVAKNYGVGLLDMMLGN